MWMALLRILIIKLYKLSSFNSNIFTKDSEITKISQFSKHKIHFTLISLIMGTVCVQLSCPEILLHGTGVLVHHRPCMYCILYTPKWPCFEIDIRQTRDLNAATFKNLH